MGSRHRGETRLSGTLFFENMTAERLMQKKFLVFICDAQQIIKHDVLSYKDFFKNNPQKQQYTTGRSFLTGGRCRLTPPNWQVNTLTLIGAVCVGLVAVVPAVIIPVTGPVIWDAAAAVTLELSAGAGVTAACLIAVIPAVVI